MKRSLAKCYKSDSSKILFINKNFYFPFSDYHCLEELRSNAIADEDKMSLCFSNELEYVNVCSNIFHNYIYFISYIFHNLFEKI